MENLPIEAVECLNNYIREWNAGNWIPMYKYCTRTWDATTTDKRFWCRRVLRPMRFKNTAVMDCTIHSEVFVEITVLGTLEVLHKDKVKWRGAKRLTFNLIKESGIRTPDPLGVWGVNPISMLRGLNCESTNG